MEPELTIQQVAQATGLSVHTLRYYERCDLIAPIGRSTSGHRRYSANDLRWIEFLNKLRLTGMPIRQMQQYAELVRSQPDSGFHRRRQMLESHREAVLAQIQQLQDNLAVIDWKIQHYSELEVTLNDSLKTPPQTHWRSLSKGESA
ncbi:MerR family transcriptional regulator [Nodosilinea sp. LEGE 06152]|uniref:MerR family transcriptional regulator n=1 Tax=Nodosilinea sp. LEGE 06152 TaxID=2777966 RepID=UPI00187F44CD|nr:MerR family transcriptional regulator [Nodosilinea sp. LEGE 06152]MBE9158056.1 MerR family transcriptional regulator [Nodosilinea sp. LEGE 06152]